MQVTLGAWNSGETADGSLLETARSLGLTRRGLYLKMERLDIANDYVTA